MVAVASAAAAGDKKEKFETAENNLYGAAAYGAGTYSGLGAGAYSGLGAYAGAPTAAAYQGLGYSGLGYQGLGYNGLGYNQYSKHSQNSVQKLLKIVL